ncbi:MAG: hypothetical protein P1U54_02380 [Immundisolibacteraceae bacterium]|nr:hypothetical protein [Immundisolibacteraceae bacterium]
MGTHFYMSRQRWVATLILALSMLVFWWAVGVRLTGASELDRQRQRQQALEFRIDTLRGQRDALNIAEAVDTRKQIRQRFLVDPDGLPGLIDELQGLATPFGINVGIEVSESSPFESVEGVSTRDFMLRFSGVNYDSLVDYLGAIERESPRWVLLVRDASLRGRGGEAEVSGWVQLRFWTTQASSTEQLDLLF